MYTFSTLTCKFFKAKVDAGKGHRFRGPTLVTEMGFVVGQRVLPSKTKTTSLLPPLTWLVPLPHYSAPFSAFVYVTWAPLCPLLPLHHRVFNPFAAISFPFFHVPHFLCFS